MTKAIFVFEICELKFIYMYIITYLMQIRYVLTCAMNVKHLGSDWVGKRVLLSRDIALNYGLNILNIT